MLATLVIGGSPAHATPPLPVLEDEVEVSQAQTVTVDLEDLAAADTLELNAKPISDNSAAAECHTPEFRVAPPVGWLSSMTMRTSTACPAGTYYFGNSPTALTCRRNTARR